MGVAVGKVDSRRNQSFAIGWMVWMAIATCEGKLFRSGWVGGWPEDIVDSGTSYQLREDKLGPCRSFVLCREVDSDVVSRTTVFLVASYWLRIHNTFTYTVLEP